jgi:hypothetical protein
MVTGPVVQMLERNRYGNRIIPPTFNMIANVFQQMGSEVSSTAWLDADGSSNESDRSWCRCDIML